MHSEVFTPHPLMPSKFEKRDLREKPRNLLQSDEQCPGAPLSHLRKIPSATSGSNKGVKNCAESPFRGYCSALGGRKILRNASQ